MSTRRLLRIMAGELMTPAQRMAARLERRDRRLAAELQEYHRLGEMIERRQKGDESLPPMPLNFQEIERRRKDGGTR